MSQTPAAAVFAAHVDQVVAAAVEWQRGAIGWFEMLRRADVTRAGEVILENLSTYADAGAVRSTATAAVRAGNP